LAEAEVLLDGEARRAAIAEGAAALAGEVGGRVVPDEDLLDVVKNLVEKPWPIRGSFDAAFLDIPKEVLISEMREHQKCFAIEDDAGKLLPVFAVVAGSKPPDPDFVAAGHARVLRARFEDGAFYFRDDVKMPLADRVEKLGRVTFQRDLGTLLDKVHRIERLVGLMGQDLDLDADAVKTTQRAAHLCKADLITGVVGEFPELQGTMGRIYAEKSGESDEVARAIEEHYLPRHAGDALPQSQAGALVGLADRLDTLVGIIGIGKSPKGSHDPFALRRAAIAIAHILIERRHRLSLEKAIHDATNSFEDRLTHSPDQILEDVRGFIRARLKGVILERCQQAGLNAEADLIDAAIAAGDDDLPDLDARVMALAALRHKAHDEFLQLAATFKRVGNIVKKARADGTFPDQDAIDLSLLTEAAEKELHDGVKALMNKSAGASEAGDLETGYRQHLESVAGLKARVDQFFDDVMVMAEDPALRAARLGLLAQLEGEVLSVADFTRIQAD
jgi:glycyl-tRNA synthetase beta chain